MALDKAIRTAQERSQEEVQEVERKKQEVTADSNKLKKEARNKALVDKLGRLHACPRLCRGEECTGTPCGEEEPGFSYSHLDNMVVCTDKAHVSMTTRAGCLLFHQWPKRSPRTPPAGPPAICPKNSGGRTSGARQAPPKTPGRKGEQDPAPAAASRAAAAAVARPGPPEGDQEVKPRVGGCEDKHKCEDERDVVRKCREGLHDTTPTTLTPATPSATATATAHSRGQPQARPGS
jgi:hypothetical protein